jgi:hypothetical protein
MKGPKFKTSMLSYCKTILEKLKFNQILFRKEYRKTFIYLNKTEQTQLKQWLRDNRKNL